MGIQPPPRKGAEHPPQFLAHFYCGQTAACIKMPLGKEVGLVPGHIVLDGDPVGTQSSIAAPPHFRPMPRTNGRPSQQLLSSCYCDQTAGCIKMSLGMEVGLSPGDFVLDGDASSTFPKRRRSPPPNFRPIFIVVKRLDASKCHMVWR